MTLKTPKKPKPPFVIDMRHNSSADSSYGIATTWDDAIKIAADFWDSYDGLYDPKTKKWSVGEGYSEELDVTVKKGVYFSLMHAGGEGPYITIRRASNVVL